MTLETDEQPESVPRNIHQRLHACMKGAARIGKERKQGIQWEIVSHDAVTDAVRPLLVEHGVLSVPTVTNRGQDGNRTEVDVRVDFINIDNPEDRVSVDFFGYGIDGQDKGPGKALSYAVKYAMLKTLALGTGEDADNDTSQDHKSGNGQAKKAAPKAPPPEVPEGDPPWKAKLAEVKRRFAGAANEEALKAISQDLKADIAAMPEPQQDECRTAYATSLQAIAQTIEA